MSDMMILETVERYIRGEMNPDERLQFENLRKSNPEVDQLVVEHTLFLQQMNRFGEWKKFRSTLHDVHTHLAEQGKIESPKLKGKAKMIYLWKRYQRVAAIAASIAGVTTLSIIALVLFFNPATPNRDIQILNRELKNLKSRTDRQDLEINRVKTKVAEVPSVNYKTGGSSFIIDGKGFLVTNAHVIQNASNIAVENTEGENYSARLVYSDSRRDIAILKIEDSAFKPFSYIPYSVTRFPAERAEPVFTLGYPRNEIVYSEGYLSAKTGFNGDSLTFQLEVAVNPGNSGGPVFNKNGEIIGILSTRQKTAEGVVFATQARYIFTALAELKEMQDSDFQKLKLPVTNTIKNLDRVQQVKRVEDYVFMVKVY